MSARPRWPSPASGHHRGGPVGGSVLGEGAGCVNAEVKRMPVAAAGDAQRVARPAQARTPVLDLRIIDTGVAREAERSALSWNAWRPRPRQALFLAVVALHVGVLALLLMPRARESLPIALPSIQAQIITDAPVQPQTPPLPQLTLERPHIDLITPIVPITEPAPDAPHGFAAHGPGSSGGGPRERLARSGRTRDPRRALMRHT